jgi:RND family efflux transporter MFP subunit
VSTSTAAPPARRIACVAAWLSLFVGLAGCGNTGSAPPEHPGTAAAGPPTIEVVRVVRQTTNVVLAMPGQLDPYEMVAVYPKVTGFVKAIRVDRGSRVRTGQVMAELDAPELLAQRAEAQSKLQAAEAQLAAAQSKADADASTYDKLTAASATPGVVAGNDLVLAQKSVEAARSQIAAARQTAEAARQALHSVTQMEEYLRVTAPFDGVVTERNVHPGALVGPNSGPAAATPMVRVVQSDRLRLVVPVPEAYTAGVVAGEARSFTVPAYPGQSFSGTVARIAQAVDVKTRTMAVELDVMNQDGRLAPGTFCQVQWPVRRPAPSLFVPESSVGNTTERTFVVRIRDGRAEWVDVRTGLASGALMEVFGDLQPGDQVAVHGTDELKAGTRVRVKDVTSSSAMSRASALIVHGTDGNRLRRCSNAGCLGIQRDLQDTVPLMAEQIEGLDDVVEGEPVRHQGRQVHTAILDHRHQAPHSFFAARTECRHDLLIAQPCIEGLVGRHDLA